MSLTLEGFKIIKSAYKELDIKIYAGTDPQWVKQTKLLDQWSGIQFENDL